MFQSVQILVYTGAQKPSQPSDQKIPMTLEGIRDARLSLNGFQMLCARESAVCLLVRGNLVSEYLRRLTILHELAELTKVMKPLQGSEGDGMAYANGLGWLVLVSITEPVWKVTAYYNRF